MGTGGRGDIAMVGHAYRILLVDDDVASLDVLAEVLKRAGYEICSAANGYDALKLLQENVIDLAILDYELPDITGLELLEYIRPMQSGVPVIIMSGNTSQNVKREVFEAGAYTFIPKPIDLPQFLHFVARALTFKQQSAVHPSPRSHVIRITQSIFFRWIRKDK
jgi:two-component system, NtrC family, nitrogen regulation response regulator NtrX